MYVYIKSSPTTWTVGFYTNEGERWNAESDHFSEEAARKQVAYLNGVSALKTNDDIVGCISSLKRKLAEVEAERDALRELNVELSCALKSLLVIVEWEHIQKVWMPDHACKQCRPGSELIVDGFKCGLHAARAVVIKIDSPEK